MKEALTAQIITDLFPVILPENSGLRRQPVAPERKRSDAFWQAFEDRIIYYTAFHRAEFSDILLVGPAALNLEAALSAAHFTLNGREVVAEHFSTRTTLVTRLSVPNETPENLTLHIAETELPITISPDLSDRFAGRKLVATINKDNDLQWITDWAHYYSEMHGADGFIIVDNSSTNYTLDQLSQSLGEIVPQAETLVISAPHKFGPIDRAARAHPYRYRFLQSAMQTMIFRHFASQASGLLFADIDELVQPEDTSLFRRLHAADAGLIQFDGIWMSSAVRSGTSANRHMDFHFLSPWPMRNFCPKKYAINPCHPAMQDLNIIPQLHRVWNIPRAPIKGGRFWHFRGISTNWKTLRRAISAPIPMLHTTDRNWVKIASDMTQFPKWAQKRTGTN